jgi:hypothetical protein
MSEFISVLQCPKCGFIGDEKKDFDFYGMPYYHDENDTPEIEYGCRKCWGYFMIKVDPTTYTVRKTMPNISFRKLTK